MQSGPMRKYAVFSPRCSLRSGFLTSTNHSGTPRGAMRGGQNASDSAYERKFRAHRASPVTFPCLTPLLRSGTSLAPSTLQHGRQDRAREPWVRSNEERARR